MSLDFTIRPVRGLGSVAGLFPAEAGLRGIYVLHFTDGMAYVGQTVNIWNRYTDHLHTYRDIEVIEFARVPDHPGSPSSDGLEQDEIRARAQARDLRNIRHYLPAGNRPNRLDPVVPPTHQLSFQDGVDIADIEGRVVTDEQRETGRKAFDRLCSNPFADVAAYLAACYVTTAIPSPRATERRFWALSAAPSTNSGNRLFCFSINQPETFVLFDMGDWVHGFMNVSRTALAHAYDSLDEFAARFGGWIDADENAGYEACGGDAVRLRIDGEQNWFRVFEDPEFAGILNAARVMNLNLMRKGPTFQAKGHNVPLADAILDGILAFEENESSAEGTSAQDSPEHYAEFDGRLLRAAGPEPSRTELFDVVVAIVATEGPVVGTRVHRAFARATGMTRLGAPLRGRLDAALSSAVRRGALVQDAPLGERPLADRTYRLPGQPLVRVRTLGAREFDQVPPRELAAVLDRVAGTNASDDPVVVARSAAAHYGISRLGTVVRARLEAARPLCEPRQR